MINGTLCLKKTLSPTNAWELCHCFHGYAAFGKHCQNAEATWKLNQLAAPTQDTFSQGGIHHSSPTAPESSRPWPYSSNYWNFMGDIGQRTSSCPSCCPSFPYTAAAPLPTHRPCTQSVYDATQKAPVHFCLSLLQQELNFATLSSCLPLPSAPLILVAHSKSLPNWDPSAPPICSVLFSPFSSASDSVKPCSFSSSTVHTPLLQKQAPPSCSPAYPLQPPNPLWILWIAQLPSCYTWY